MPAFMWTTVPPAKSSTKILLPIMPVGPKMPPPQTPSAIGA